MGCDLSKPKNVHKPRQVEPRSPTKEVRKVSSLQLSGKNCSARQQTQDNTLPLRATTSLIEPEYFPELQDKESPKKNKNSEMKVSESDEDDQQYGQVQEKQRGNEDESDWKSAAFPSLHYQEKQDTEQYDEDGNLKIIPEMDSYLEAGGSSIFLRKKSSRFMSIGQNSCILSKSASLITFRGSGSRIIKPGRGEQKVKIYERPSLEITCLETDQGFQPKYASDIVQRGRGNL